MSTLSDVVQPSNAANDTLLPMITATITKLRSVTERVTAATAPAEAVDETTAADAQAISEVDADTDTGFDMAAIDAALGYSVEI